MKIPCSNCGTTITLSRNDATVKATLPGSGRGSKRVEPRTVVNILFDEEGFLTWEAPCCADYWDSFDPWS
jgi:hypothetical protein